ncbi:MAG TPA: YbaK/EbsC family protein [Bryobacteraceae bacterium]|jgi:Ala-tRNA(Pro) deacylase|nr:YbaK/EbsC family protein [Bryobacteraceae bacterium]
MTFLNRLTRYLDAKGIRFSHSIHTPAQTALSVAKAERMPAHEFAKTVVYFGDSGYGMAVVPADDMVDLQELRQSLGLSFIRLADENELQELFPDCELGAMPPFGTFHDLPVVVDTQLAHRRFITFTAGTHRDVIRMSSDDFQHLVRPKVGSFAIAEALV